MTDPLQGRDLGVARQRLRALVRPDVNAPTTVERIELGLAWFVSGDGLAYPSLEALRVRIAEMDDGGGLHRSTIAHHVTRLPHYLTVGYFARHDGKDHNGALRGVAVRAVRPDVAVTLGFPPLGDALDRLEQERWVLATTDFVTTLWRLQRTTRKTSVHA